MAIAKMKLINISSDIDNLHPVLLKFVQLDFFHPEPANKIINQVHGASILDEENPIIEKLNYLAEVKSAMGFDEECRIIPCDSDSHVEKDMQYVEKMYQKFKDANDIRNDIKKVIQDNKDALFQMRNIIKMDLDLDELFACEYVKFRFGRLPLESVKKLSYYDSHPFYFQSFLEDDTYSWCFYLTSKKYETDLDNIFSSLYFERVYIPDFVHGTPLEAVEILNSEIENDYKQLQHVEEVLSQIKNQCKNELLRIEGEWMFINKSLQARKYVMLLGERFTIMGFVDEKDVDKLKQVYQNDKEVEIEVRPAHSDKRLTPPTKLNNGWFARPFSMFVEMYGVPEYDSIDPTPIVAITYSLLFGIMFGDVGQGLILMLVGYLFYRFKKMTLGAIGVRIGIFSTIFGFIYGSIFGNEEALNPMFQILGFEEKPIEVMSADFIPILLVMAVGIGALLIIFSISMNIYLSAKNKNYCEMALSANGICGLVFYISLLVGGVMTLLTPIALLTNPIYILLCLLLPIVLIFLKEGIEHKLHHQVMFPSGFGAYFVESFFELFEILLSFITNTISYLRVGGFVLSHAGMMMAVTLIANMSGGGIGWVIAMIIGNIIVMVIEGMIVGIQVLRLEFYEMFSRYFNGNGVVFKAISE